MNLLFRLSQNIVGFEDIESTKSFFINILPKKDNNYFFHSKKFSKDKIKMNDIIYFSYDRYIVAKAIFMDEIKTLPDRHIKFIHGHKLENIKIINSDLELNFKKFKAGHSMKYIDTDEWQKEIDRVINQELIEIYPDDIEDESEDLFEGAKKQTTVNAYERSSQARKECIEYYGYKCQICDFDFEKVYGDIGKGFIHVHHIVDISTIGENYKIDPIKDLIPVCPNCHAMLHKRKPAYSIKEIKDLI
jgi:predicted HNH restriction endonuclease